MNIAIDIDDTLTNSFDYFQPYVAEYFGSTLAYVKDNNISYSNLPDEWKIDELGFCKKYYDRIVVDTPFKEEAAKTVKKLRSLGHKIIIITGRTTAFYTDPYKTTTEELNRGNIEYDKLICTLEKGKACKEEKIDILIDDLIHNCEAAEKIGIKAILFTSKANQGIETQLPRLENWNDIDKYEFENHNFISGY